MKKSLSPQFQRVAAITLLFVVLAGGAGGLVYPLVSFSKSYDDSINELRFRLTKYHQTASQRFGLQERLETLLENQTDDEQFIHGDNSDLAGAELNKLVKNLIVKSGGKVESRLILPLIQNKFMDRIMLRTQFSGNNVVLTKTLYALESVKPKLFVDRIEIKRRTVTKISVIDPILSVTVDVFGYRRGESQ